MAEKKPSRYTTDVDAALNEQPLPQQPDPEKPVQVTPPKGGMSEAALARCRRLTITDVSDEDSPFRKELMVHPPSPDDRVLETIVVRTPQDLARVKRSYMAKYRIPPENITEEEADGGPTEG